MPLLTPLPGADWLPVAAQVVLKATLVLAAGAVAAVLLRRASAAARHLAWTLSLGALLALPLLALAVPDWRVPLLPAAPPAAMAAREWTPSAEAPSGHTAAAEHAPAAPAEAAAAPVASVAGWTWVEWMAAAWGAGALFVLLRLSVGLAAVRRMGRRASPVTDEEWLFLCDELSYELRMKRPVRLLVGAGATMPMTFGVLRPAILLPADAEGWDDERRRVVLLHELAHVQRLDTFTQTLAQLCCALYWFHPGAWWASARMRAERERACDDRVLGAGARASAYASHLIEVARRFGSMRMAGSAAVAMARPSQLEGRVLAVLDEKAERRGLSRRRVALAAAAVLAVVLPLAALHPVGRAVAREVKPSAWTEKDAKTKGMADVEHAALRAHDEAGADAEALKDTVNPRVTAALAGALGDQNVEVRRAAVAALGEQEDPNALQALLGALRDSDAEVRRHAAFALGQIDDREAVPGLLAATRDADA
ncbi:MAG TPA: M56 family metallopeptidase, partial [Longimicrobium sp.]|nr:M56 family metallopeptidase [Longimicrobium sp.]